MMLSTRLISGVLQFSILIPFVVMSSRVLTRRDLTMISLVFFIFLFDNLQLDLFSGIVLFKGQQWNWMGKLGSIAWALCFTYLNPILNKKQIGWTRHFRPHSCRPAAVFMALLLGVRGLQYIIFRDGASSFHLESVLFQATLPGMAEELVYRGILSGLLARVWPPQWLFFKAKIGWGVILTSVLFGAVHGLSVDAGFHLHFQFYTLLITGLWGFAFAVLKERTGSLIPSMILHNAVNLIGIH